MRLNPFFRSSRTYFLVVRRFTCPVTGRDRLFSKSPDKSGNYIIFENTNCIYRVKLPSREKDEIWFPGVNRIILGKKLFKRGQMKNFQDRVALITGGAAGSEGRPPSSSPALGRGIARLMFAQILKFKRRAGL